MNKFINNKIASIFFDFGNTLVHYHNGKLSDNEKDFIGIKQMYEFLKNFDNELSFTKLYEDFYLKWAEKLKTRNICKTEYNALDFLLPVLNSKFKNQITDTQIISAFKYFHEPTVRFAECEKNIINTLQNLKNKNFKLGIISNSPIPGYCHDETLEYLGILEYFENRFYSYDLNFKKPDKKIFDYAMNESNSKFQESIFIGDSLELDIIPALKFNMKAILLNSKGIYIPDKIYRNNNFCGEIKYLKELTEDPVVLEQ